MEHKIGEIITLPDGRKAEVVEWDRQSERCEGCIFYKKWKAPYREDCLNTDLSVRCSKIFRSDNKDIIYKEIKEDKQRVNLELGQFDIELILKTLKKAYYNSRREVKVDSQWVRNGLVTDFVPSHTEWVETKESKQLKSTIKYIEKQIKEDK